jgi:hypothetical protein
MYPFTPKKILTHLLEVEGGDGFKNLAQAADRYRFS